MKLLAIHSNKLFFKTKTPNFYEWLAEQRGLLKQYKPLKKGYNQGKKGPRYLKNTYCLTTAGLTPFELEKYCSEYCDLFFNRRMFQQIKNASRVAKIAIFTSYPQEIYGSLKDSVYKIYGSNYVLGEHAIKITDLDNIHPRILPWFNKKEQLSYGAKLKSMNIPPDRYGLLVLLVNEIIINGLLKGDIVILGKGVTAQPMHKVAGRVIKNLNEL